MASKLNQSKVSPDKVSSTSPTDKLRDITSRLRDDGFKMETATIGSVKAVVGRKSKFRLLWLATQMNYFVIIGVVDAISEKIILEYSKRCMEYAIKNNEGLPRGMQGAVVSFGVLISNNVNKSGTDYVCSRPPRHFAAFEMPVIYDGKNKRLYYYDKTPLWGLIYYRGFRNLIKKYLA